MKNKVLVELVVPALEVKYDVYVPVNRKIGSVVVLLTKAMSELSGGYSDSIKNFSLYDGISGHQYSPDQLIRNSNIRNGSKIILM